MSELTEFATLPWALRASSAPALPGGIALQKIRLVELLAHIEGTAPADWIVDDDGLKTAFHQIGSLAFAERVKDGFALTALGAEWLRTLDDTDLFRVLHGRLSFVGELLAKLEGPGARVEELLSDANTEFHLGWTSPDQVRRRLAWMHALGLAEDGPDRLHLITEKGRLALEAVELADPQQLMAAMTLDGQAELEPAPPLLADLLLDQSASRRLAIGYVPRDPLAAFSALARIAEGGVDRQDLIAQLAKQFEISDSSAKSLVATARTLGLHKYTGRETIAPTGLGVEFAENATPLNLVRLMHSHHSAFGEALVSLTTTPVTAGDVHRALFSRQKRAPHPSRTSGVLRRLVDAGAASEIGYAKFVITPVGRSLLKELPLIDLSEDGADSEVAPADNYLPSMTVADQLVGELLAASTDAAHPDRFEKATEAAFRLLGVEAKHIGGSGATDVLLSITSNLALLGRAIVDSKSAASGQLREDSVVIDTLKEHAKKHGADHIAVVAPGYENAGRLPDRAKTNGIVLLTAAQIGEMVIAHQRLPYSPQDLLGVLTVGQDTDVAERRLVEEADLALLGKVLSELHAEAAEDAAEAITARDIYRLLRKDEAVTEADVADALRFLTHPRIAAVAENKQGGFTLPADLRNASIRLRTLADVIDSATRASDLTN